MKKSKKLILLALWLLGFFFVKVAVYTGNTLWGWLGVILACLAFIIWAINNSKNRKKNVKREIETE